MKILFLLTGLLLVACAQENSETEQSTPPAVINSDGYKAYIDPATGELLQEPPLNQDGQIPSANTTTAPVIEQQPLPVIPSEVPGGGEMIRLDNRFMKDTKTDNSDEQE